MKGRKKGQRTVPEIVKLTVSEILSEARKTNTKMTAPALKKTTEAKLKKQGWNIKYTDRTYLKIKDEVEANLELNGLDAPWSIGSCLVIGISTESIPVLLDIKRLLSNPHETFKKVPLTNRMARWINLLWKGVFEITKQQPNENESQLTIRRLEYVTEIGMQYSFKELMAKSTVDNIFDTTDLDKLFLVDGVQPDKVKQKLILDEINQLKNDQRKKGW
jgi:hypothetical protein